MAAYQLMGAVKRTTTGQAASGLPIISKQEKSRFEESKEDGSFEAALAAVKALEAKKNQAVVEAKVRFAGQSYSVERAKTESDTRQEQR